MCRKLLLPSQVLQPTMCDTVHEEPTMVTLSKTCRLEFDAPSHAADRVRCGTLKGSPRVKDGADQTCHVYVFEKDEPLDEAFTLMRAHALLYDSAEVLYVSSALQALFDDGESTGIATGTLYLVVRKHLETLRTRLDVLVSDPESLAAAAAPAAAAQSCAQPLLLHRHALLRATLLAMRHAVQSGVSHCNLRPENLAVVETSTHSLEPTFEVRLQLLSHCTFDDGKYNSKLGMTTDAWTIPSATFVASGVQRDMWSTALIAYEVVHGRSLPHGHGAATMPALYFDWEFSKKEWDFCGERTPVVVLAWQLSAAERALVKTKLPPAVPAGANVLLADLIKKLLSTFKDSPSRLQRNDLARLFDAGFFTNTPEEIVKMLVVERHRAGSLNESRALVSARDKVAHAVDPAGTVAWMLFNDAQNSLLALNQIPSRARASPPMVVSDVPRQHARSTGKGGGR